MKLGNYEILHDLAAGGMATVYVARHAGAGGFERLVVVKRVHPHLLRNREFFDMFRDEARVAALIRHPNVVSVIDVVESEGELLLVLDYVESISLSALIRAARANDQRLPLGVVSRILSDTLAGLHAAHEAVDLRAHRLDVVHRDVSPQNIVVGTDGTSRLIDFGIAKAASRVTATKTGEVKGKLAYMAPEQLRGREVDHRADIFAAGLVLFEALTGRRLVSGEADAEVLVNILTSDVPLLELLGDGYPPALNGVIQKAIEHDREDRFSSAAEFRRALEDVLPASPDSEVAQVVMRYGEDAIMTVRRTIARRIDETKTSLETAPKKRSRRAALIALSALGLVPMGFWWARRAPAIKIEQEAPAVSSSLPEASEVETAPPPATTPSTSASTAPRRAHPVKNPGRPRPSAPDGLRDNPYR